MVWLYLCKACENGNHGACEIGESHPGVYGGSHCRCPCCGQADWGTPEYNERELRKIVESMLDHKKAVEELKNKPMEVNGPPKKIELKNPK